MEFCVSHFEHWIIFELAQLLFLLYNDRPIFLAFAAGERLNLSVHSFTDKQGATHQVIVLIVSNAYFAFPPKFSLKSSNLLIGAELSGAHSSGYWRTCWHRRQVIRFILFVLIVYFACVHLNSEYLFVSLAVSILRIHGFLFSLLMQII